jgi:hypothetical protein
MAIRNLFTSNSKQSWKRFWKFFLGSFVAANLVVYVGCYFVDPYDIYPFSLNITRQQVARHQEYFYPMLARDPAYDSIVMGTSTSRLLNPAKLNDVFGGSFVNIAMNNGAAYFQTKLLDVFTRSHDRMKTVIIGLDVVWMEPEAHYSKYHGYGGVFPEWLYDDVPWNNILPYSMLTLKHSLRTVLVASGLKKNKYGTNGYTVFTPPPEAYDIDKARINIYGTAEPKSWDPISPAVKIPENESEAMKFPAHAMLKDCLDRLPESTLKIIFFVPYHVYYQKQPGSYDAAVIDIAKQRITTLASQYENAHVLDFMIPSEITVQDTNYWDRVHYTVEIADLMADLLGYGVKNKCHYANYFKYLSPSSELCEDQESSQSYRQIWSLLNGSQSQSPE